MRKEPQGTKNRRAKWMEGGGYWAWGDECGRGSGGGGEGVVRKDCRGG